MTPEAATPGTPATPASSENGSNPPAAAPAAPATPAPAGTPAGTVTISVEEYAKLQRNNARARSFDKRVYNKPASPAANVDPNDPSAAALIEVTAQRDAAERRAMQVEVKGKLRDLLADDRFKGLPESTKKLILDSPHMLTQAQTLDEAMYDIEDKLIELAGTPNNQPVPPINPAVPSNRETPPIVSPGNPAPVDAGVMEDTTNLRGSARSTAVIRNALRQHQGGTK